MIFNKKIIGLFAMLLLFAVAHSQDSKHIFSLGKQEFLLDGKPFQIISGEMHPEGILAAPHTDGKGDGMQYHCGLFYVELPGNSARPI